MEIFHYHPDTLQLIGVGVADADPLEVENWLIPAYATSVNPPQPVEGKTRHFVDGTWVYQDIPTPEPDLPPELPAVNEHPAPVSPRQIRQALSRAGLRTAVEAAIAAGDQDGKDWWEFATQFERLHPTVVAMGQALGQTDEQMDALWQLAATL